MSNIEKKLTDNVETPADTIAFLSGIVLGAILIGLLTWLSLITLSAISASIVLLGSISLCLLISKIISLPKNFNSKAKLEKQASALSKTINVYYANKIPIELHERLEKEYGLWVSDFIDNATFKERLDEIKKDVKIIIDPVLIERNPLHERLEVNDTSELRQIASVEE